MSLPDLHGRDDLLRLALDYYSPDTHFVSLGDVIDRGPGGLEAVRRLMELEAQGRATLLRGNHEALALMPLELYGHYQRSGNLEAYREALTAFGRWLSAGGEAVVQEYGGFGVENYPPELEAYLRSTRIAAYVDAHGVHAQVPEGPSVLCTHAAPPVAFGPYSAEDAALWLRPKDGPFPLPGGVVLSVHGHTPVAEPSRIGDHLYTDLYAVRSGTLCCVRLDDVPARLSEGRPLEVTLLGYPTASVRFRHERLARLGTPLPHRAVEVRG